MTDIKIFTNGRGRQGGWPGAGGILFFDILLYYFFNVIIIKTYISSFNVVYVIYFTHS